MFELSKSAVRKREQDNKYTIVVVEQLVFLFTMGDKFINVWPKWELHNIKPGTLDVHAK